MISTLINFSLSAIPFLSILGVMFFFIRAGWQVDEYGRTFVEGHSLADYVKAHPQSFRADGSFARCHACGGRHFWAKWAAKTVHGSHYSHVCRQCGCELWRTTL